MSDNDYRYHDDRFVTYFTDVFNTPDRLPPEHTKTALLTASGMLDTTCTTRRLRKLKPSMCCPIILQFQDENDAVRLLTSQALLCSTEKFRTIKIKAARTGTQRKLTKKLPPSTLPTDALLNTSSTHMINKVTKPPIVQTTGASTNGAHRCPIANLRSTCATANSIPYAVLPKPVAPPTASTRVDAPLIPLNSQCYMITPSTEPTPNYSAPSSFIALQGPGHSTAPTSGVSALPLMKTPNVSISPVDLSPEGGLGVSEYDRNIFKEREHAVGMLVVNPANLCVVVDKTYE
ncbi:hypothetical protein CLF_100073 [Clonorchis sinensis]|uniref:Uncharacterized protein n=1 Tax=Clonorchis sinensis TaxID=79923 RepID=G7Y2M6_CLOSI|nr:hypothetical protein CLF_100073 [Clonorchis sinensis]